MKKLKITWTKILHFGTSVTSCGRELHIDITGEAREWFVYTLETGTDPVGLEDTLKGGMHRVIGVFRSRDRAMREAEKYVRRWLRERARMMMPRPKAVSDVEPGFDDPPPSAADDLSVN